MKLWGFKTGVSFIRGIENVLLSFVAAEHFGHKILAYSTNWNLKGKKLRGMN